MPPETAPETTTGGAGASAVPGPPDATTPDSPRPAETQATTGSTEAKAADAARAAPAGDADNSKLEKENAGKPKDEKPKEERGFFGRMLDKIGF
jgi:hypothetical protein